MTPPLNDSTALVVLSGGQDSTTCLYWALNTFSEVHAITFNYGQRHAIELDAARKVAEMAGVSKTHEIIDLGPVLVGSSPLVNGEVDVEHYENADAMPDGVEPTFVPARNALFLTIAGNRAVQLGAAHVVTGVSQEDYGGYFDCREAFIRAQQVALNQALFGSKVGLTIETPLMNLDKAQTVDLADSIPGCLEALAWSHTCYDGQYPPNPNNHASIVRARGFERAGVPDPLITRAKAEGLLPESYSPFGIAPEGDSNV